MSIVGICNVKRLERYLDECVLKIENTTDDSEQLLIDIIKMIDSLAAYEISLLCKSKILSHRFFTKFRHCYNVQLNIWRRKLGFNDLAQQVLSKMGNLFVTLSEHVLDNDIVTFEQFLFEKSLIKELCLCLKDVVYRIGDPNISCIGSLMFSIGCFQYNERTLQNNSLQEELVDAIIECLAYPWYQMCLCDEMTASQKNIFDVCLDYILDSANDHRKRSCDIISKELIATFPQWFHEQVANASVLNWSEQMVLIISKLIFVLTNQVWEFDNRINEVHINSYTLLVESLVLIFSKTLVKYNQTDKDKIDLTTGIFLRNLTDLALDSHIMVIINQKNFSQIYSYMIQNERPDIQMDACHLLLTTLTQTELPSQFDANKCISVVLKSLVSDDGTSKRRHRLIATMIHLQRKLFRNSAFDIFLIIIAYIWNDLAYIQLMEKKGIMVRNIGGPAVKYWVGQEQLLEAQLPKKIVLGINFYQIIGYSKYFRWGNCPTLPCWRPADG